MRREHPRGIAGTFPKFIAADTKNINSNVHERMHVCMCARMRVAACGLTISASLCADLQVPTRIHVLTDAPLSHAHTQPKKTALLMCMRVCLLLVHACARVCVCVRMCVAACISRVFASLCSTILRMHPSLRPVLEVRMNTDARVQLRALRLGRYTPASKMYVCVNACVYVYMCTHTCDCRRAHAPTRAGERTHTLRR